MEDKEKEDIKRLEQEIKQKAKELRQSLEAPFDNVGAAHTAAGLVRGRPKPNKIEAVDGNAINPNEAAHSQRMSEITRPASDSSPESMRDWTEKEIHKLAPEAIASLKWDIKYGDKAAIAQARKEIFQAMGVDKKEANNFGKGGQIVINLGGTPGDIQLPFLKRQTNNETPTAPILASIEANAIAKKKEGE